MGSEPVVYGFLTSPEGQTLASSVIPQPSGPQVLGVTKIDPEAGRWTFTAVVANPVGGTAVSVPFTRQRLVAAVPDQGLGGARQHRQHDSGRRFDQRVGRR